MRCRIMRQLHDVTTDEGRTFDNIARMDAAKIRPDRRYATHPGNGARLMRTTPAMNDEKGSLYAPRRPTWPATRRPRLYRSCTNAGSRICRRTAILGQAAPVATHVVPLLSPALRRVKRRQKLEGLADIIMPPAQNGCKPAESNVIAHELR